MTLLEHIMSADKSKNIIFTDKYNENNGFYVDINKLHRLENGEQILEIISLFIAGYIGCPFYTPTKITEDIRYIDGKAFEFLNTTDLIIDEEVADYESWARRPYYRLRGKRVTEQQAFEVISKADRFFNHEVESVQSINLLHFPNWWFNRNHYPTHYGWCHPSGIIGSNSITDKYPTTDKLLIDIIKIKYSFPYLDFVVAIAGWDEVHPDYYDWEEEATRGITDTKKQLDALRKLAYREYPDFLENIEIGILVHENTIEFMKPSKARKKYLEYEKLYGEANKGIYVSEYYQDHKILTADIAYLKRCIETYGLNPDEELAKIKPYIWKGLK